MEADRTGTLKTEHKIQLALAALSILPAARGANIIKLGARSFRVIGVVEQQANVFLLAETADGEIRNLRNSQITELARLHGDIERLRGQNKSDPQLREMEYRADVLRDEIRNASFTVLSSSPRASCPDGPREGDRALRGQVLRRQGPPRRRRPGAPPARRRHAGTGREARRAGRPDPVGGPPAEHAPRGRGLRDENVHDNTVRVQYSSTAKASSRASRSRRAGRRRPTTFGCTRAPPS